MGIRDSCTMMEAVEAGDFSVRYSEPPADELGRLGNNFNHMLNKIQELISQIYEEQKKLRNSEFKALQAQIQPHFLYNSLDSVIWFLRMGKNKDAEKMLTELSTLFKISLSKGRETVSYTHLDVYKRQPFPTVIIPYNIITEANAVSYFPTAY